MYALRSPVLPSLGITEAISHQAFPNRYTVRGVDTGNHVVRFSFLVRHEFMKIFTSNCALMAIEGDENEHPAKNAPEESAGPVRFIVPIFIDIVYDKGLMVLW